MANEALRRRFFYVTFGGAIVAFLYFLGTSLSSGRRADTCADELAAAAMRHDAAYLDKALRNPSVKAELLGAAEVEVGFVRPVSSGWTRVGLFVRHAKTDVKMSAVVLQLSNDTAQGCVFLRDYDQGPFEGSTATTNTATSAKTATRTSTTTPR